MEQNITQEELNRLLEYIGYGNPEAPLWFLGREEGLGKRPKQPGWRLEWELKIRAAWNPVMDARQAHELLRDPYWESGSRSQVWITMAMLTRGLLHGAMDWQDPELAWKYVVDHLGRANGETLIGEAFPLAKKRIGSWPYTDLYPTQKEYKAKVWPQRQALWQKLITTHKPRYILAYGGWWESRKETFGVLKWELLNNTRVMVAKTASGALVYLMPFFNDQHLQLEDMLAVILYARGLWG